MKSYLEIGKIVTLHGLRGDVKVQPWCDDAEFLCEFPVLYLGKEKKEVEVSHARPQKTWCCCIWKVMTPQSRQKPSAIRFYT